MSKKRQKITNKAPDQVDRAIALILIENPSVTDEEIGHRLNFTRQTVNRRRKRACVKEIFSEMTAIPKSEIRRVVSKAFKKLEQLIEDADPRISLHASLSLLKLGVDLRDELKGSNGRLMGLTPFEEDSRQIELEIERDKATTLFEFHQKQAQDQLEKELEASIRKNKDSFK